MNSVTLSNIVNNLKSENITDIGVVSFFGGEPLLNKKLIIEGLELFYSTFKVSLFEIVTNGYYLDECFLKQIEKYPLNLSVSLDGLKLLQIS